MANKKSKGPRAPVSGDVATNRRARHKFQLLETTEAGIELRGSEVKSLRDGKAQLNEAYAVINDGEVWLRGAHIPPYLPASDRNHEPDQDLLQGTAGEGGAGPGEGEGGAGPPAGDRRSRRSP